MTSWDKYAGKADALIEVPARGGFADMVKLKGDKEIGDRINKIIGRLAEANDLKGVIDQADFNDEGKLGTGKEMQRIDVTILSLRRLWTIYKRTAIAQGTGVSGGEKPRNSGGESARFGK